MKKQFTVSQLCEIIDASTQYLYKVLQTPIPGVPFSKENINYEALKQFLLRKYEEEEVKELLEIDNIEDIEIVKGVKVTNSNTRKVALKDLELDTAYVLRSYHHEINVILRSILNIADDTVYVFETLKSSKNAQDKYRAITATELAAERFTIKEAE